MSVEVPMAISVDGLAHLRSLFPTKGRKISREDLEAGFPVGDLDLPRIAAQVGTTDLGAARRWMTDRFVTRLNTDRPQIIEQDGMFRPLVAPTKWTYLGHPVAEKPEEDPNAWVNLLTNQTRHLLETVTSGKVLVGTRVVDFTLNEVTSWVPMMGKEQLTAFVQDVVSRHGFDIPILGTVSRDKANRITAVDVVDGRHRVLLAVVLREQGVTLTQPLRVEPADSTASIEGIAHSGNIAGRHLETSQRAAVAALEIVRNKTKYEAEAKQKKSAGGKSAGRGMTPNRLRSHERNLLARKPSDQVAARYGISSATLRRANRVLRENPALFQQVFNGTLDVFSAEKMLSEEAEVEEAEVEEAEVEEAEVEEAEVEEAECSHCCPVHCGA